MTQHLAPPAYAGRDAAPAHVVAQSRRRFLDELDAMKAGAGACGRRFGIYLVALECVRQLEADLTADERHRLLVRARDRLALCAGEGSSIALLRRDTFGVLVPNLRSGLMAREAAVRILAALGHPMRPSIGIAVFPWDGHHASELLCCAAWALARARRQARGTYCFYLRALATSAASSSPLL